MRRAFHLINARGGAWFAEKSGLKKFKRSIAGEKSRAIGRRIDPRRAAP
jgi:hypothetical protein